MCQLYSYICRLSINALSTWVFTIGIQRTYLQQSGDCKGGDAAVAIGDKVLQVNIARRHCIRMDHRNLGIRQHGIQTLGWNGNQTAWESDIGLEWESDTGLEWESEQGFSQL